MKKWYTITGDRNMKDYVYLIISVLCVSSSGVFGGYYTRRVGERKGASAWYGFVELVAVFLFWCLLFAIEPSFHAGVVPYSLAFALCFAMGKIGCIYALQNGSVAITSLIVKSSLVAVSIWGVLCWNAPFTWRTAAGLALVVISLWLCLRKEVQAGAGEKKYSWKWLLFCLISLVGNAGCTIVQRMQQTQYNGAYGSAFMWIATFFSAIVGGVIYRKSDCKDGRLLWKENGVFPVLSGLGNVFLNVFVMLLAMSDLSSTLIYPVIAVGGLAITTCFSALAFKEALTWRQWLGLGVGTVAVALLS